MQRRLKSTPASGEDRMRMRVVCGSVCALMRREHAENSRGSGCSGRQSRGASSTVSNHERRQYGNGKHCSHMRHRERLKQRGSADGPRRKAEEGRSMRKAAPVPAVHSGRNSQPLDARTPLSLRGVSPSPR